jgi:hypothetical protein
MVLMVWDGRGGVFVVSRKIGYVGAKQTKNATHVRSALGRKRCSTHICACANAEF